MVFEFEAWSPRLGTKRLWRREDYERLASLESMREKWGRRRGGGSIEDIFDALYKSFRKRWVAGE